MQETYLPAGTYDSSSHTRQAQHQGFSPAQMQTRQLLPFISSFPVVDLFNYNQPPIHCFIG